MDTTVHAFNALRSCMTTDFTQFNLHPQLVQAVTEQGYTAPTPIQAGVIPLMLAGQDVIGQAQTGTGKTAAFALPLLHGLAPEPEHAQVQALVLVPTRELATQVAQAIDTYGQYRRVHVLPIYGGQPSSRQITRLRQGVDVVVGTPGRVLDLITQKVLDLSGVRTVVLDEADEMLSMGFIDDIEAILTVTPSTRQTTLFSATMPPAIRRLADRYLHQPQSVTIEPQRRTVDAIAQRYYLVHDEDKLAALTRLLEVETITRALIFVHTRLATADLALALSARGFPAEALSGDLSQAAREQILQRFRQQHITVLVATEVAARGLDIDGISHVVNFDFPQYPQAYVHRIGRTGRAGKTGIAISLLTPKEQWRLRKVEAYMKHKITLAPLPTEADVHARREADVLERMRVWLKRGRYSRERAMVQELMTQGYDLADVAAAALKLARAEEKQRPITPVSDVQAERSPASQRARQRGPQPNGQTWPDAWHEKGMVRLTLNVGKRHGIGPNDVVSTIARHANIPSHAIGTIRIQDHHTLVDVSERFVPQVLAKTGAYHMRRRAVQVACA
jgi:ATP-dependent RNA helicase DeaD